MTLVAGDTLIFERYTPDYVPQNGWSLLYELRGDGQPVTFTSTADNDRHQVNVAGAVTALWAAADCNLVGYAILAATGERHVIYCGQLQIFPNLGAPQNTAPQVSFDAQMITLIQGALINLAANALQRTEVEQTVIDRAKRKELEEQLAIHETKEANRIAIENVRNGRPSGQKIVSQMRIVTTTAGFAVNPVSGFLQ